MCNKHVAAKVLDVYTETYLTMLSLILLHLLTFSLIAGRSDATSTTGCKGSDGKFVDWFVIYKLPQDEKRTDMPLIAKGLAHLYLDSTAKTWTYSNASLNDSNHAIAYTMNQLYGDPGVEKNISYLLYNDQLPDGPVSFDHGHTKGVIAFDSTTGFWLVHSLPHFPERISKAKYLWPHNGLRYGQTFLCVTYGFESFNVIGKQLLYTYPMVYDSNLVPRHISSIPNLKAVLAGGHVTSEPWNRTQVLFSHQKQPFLSFAKFTKFHKDLYSEWMSDYLNAKLLVESWCDGPGDMPSACDIKYPVENIEKLLFNSSSMSLLFPTTKDHSKWAVTDELSDSTWICIGDINRQDGQKQRGGGTMCLNDWRVWQSFLYLIKQTEKCPKVEL